MLRLFAKDRRVHPRYHPCCMGYGQMCVPLDHRQRLMSQNFCNFYQAGTIHRQIRGKVVARIMEVEVYKPSTLDSILKGISDTERALACGIREDQCGIEASYLGMLCKDLQGVASERYRTGLTVLGLPEGQHPTCEVAICQAQIEHFTTSPAGG